MKNFLAIFTGSPAAMATWQQLPESEQRERGRAGIAAWHAWVDRHKDVLVDLGGPLGRTKRISPQGIEDIRNSMSGYTVLRAESQEAAAKLFLEHPHFTIFPGDGVEVMEVLPVPGMD